MKLESASFKIAGTTVNVRALSVTGLRAGCPPTVEASWIENYKATGPYAKPGDGGTRTQSLERTTSGDWSLTLARAIVVCVTGEPWQRSHSNSDIHEIASVLEQVAP